MKHRRQAERNPRLESLLVLALCLLAGPLSGLAATEPDPLMDWPAVTRDARPHSYWWWLGSAVDPVNLTRELERYHAAGLGGMHIIPIYGAKGWESNYVKYLTPEWMALLRHTVSEGRRLDLDIDMTTGSGWCFGGPGVTPLEAAAVLTTRVLEVPAGGRLQEKFKAPLPSRILAFGPSGGYLDLTAKLSGDTLQWQAEGGPWKVYALGQRPGIRVKRAAPGGEGYMLNLFYGPAMSNYLGGFDAAFRAYNGPRPRAMYHDSYEYNSSWAPDLFAQFQKRRGYALEAEIPALLDEKSTDDHAARVRCDFRETLSDLMIEDTLPQWTAWCRARGMLTRNQAHGSPGNLLDLYALADIPETEMFSRDRSKLVSKFASSAAHVAGHPLVSSETGTWLREHFTETLGDMKGLLDDLFLSGVNHVFYHGTCYSPDEAGWPGWLFYASYEMNPRNSVWRDVPALNAYVTRAQSILQSGRPDNDILVYWPIHEFWRTPGALEQKLTVHHRGWLEEQAVGALAGRLWEQGYAFDYISDRQLATVRARGAGVAAPGGEYRVIAVPGAAHIPAETLERLLELARNGAAVVFERPVPGDVPGLGAIEQQRARVTRALASAGLTNLPPAGLYQRAVGSGRVLVGDASSAFAALAIRREALVDSAKLSFVRRRAGDTYHYFVVNETSEPYAGWVPLARPAQAVVLLDPLTGRAGVGPTRKNSQGDLEVFLQLRPEASLILRALPAAASGPAWTWHEPGASHPLAGVWQVSFVQGGPVLPEPFTTERLASWAELGGEEARRFAGTARYQLTFDAPAVGKHYMLDLGQVCQSARVRLNGKDLGTLFSPPFQVLLPALQPSGNVLEVEVTNVSANRIRDLDCRKVVWKDFHDINFVNIDYKPFDSSTWPLYDSGLLGPVSLVETTRLQPK